MQAIAQTQASTETEIETNAIFRAAMSKFPSGVTVVTTVDDEGKWWGFTASSFCSLSLDPRLVLTCLATTANCYDAFANASHWAIHIIHADQTHIAGKFASRGADKFTGTRWETNGHGVPLLPDAAVMLECEAENVYPGGDHIILVGRVTQTTIGEKTPTVYFDRGFHTLD
jgi:flavin reductase ActVB